VAQAGRALVPPYWAFAPWKARDYHQNDAQVRRMWTRTASWGLPASVIVIDSPWATTYNDYKFNPKQFEDAPAMVKHIHAQGYKLVLWHTSWINSKSDPPKEAGFEGKIAPLAENYQEAADQGLFVKNPTAARMWGAGGRGWVADRLHQSEGEAVVAGPGPAGDCGRRGRLQG
jgi:alpha-D-xyloside xylohydrolase